MTSHADHAVGASKPVGKRFLWRRRICWMILGCVGLFVLRAQILGGLGQFLNIGLPLLEPVDAVYVLGGGLETRPFVAAQIYRAGFTNRILIPSPVSSGATENLTVTGETELTAAVLERLSVPQQHIVRLPQPVDSTQGEASALAEYLIKNPCRRVAIVTNDFHTRRARLIFARAIPNLTVELKYVSAPTDGFSGSDWWQHESGVETYLLEWVKLIAYMVFLR